MSQALPNDPPPPISVLDIQVALREAWPSAEPEIVPFTTGTTLRSTIWQFVVEVTLTTRPIIYGEKTGQVRMAFTWRPPNMKGSTIKTGQTEDFRVVLAFIRHCKMYLNGVSAAIEQAGEQPPPTPEADLI